MVDYEHVDLRNYVEVPMSPNCATQKIECAKTISNLLIDLDGPT